MATYSLVQHENGANVTLFLDGEVFVADQDHANFHDIVDALVSGVHEPEYLRDLFDVSHRAAREFERVTERVSVADGRVYFDGDAVDNSLSRQIMRFFRDGLSVKPLVNFMEKIAQNPVDHSREQLFDWLRDRDFTITESGDIIAYKGLRDDLTSISSGPGIVNGVEVNGNLDNTPGNTVEIARSYVTADAGIGCAQGLHAGTFDYASGFSRGKVVKVRINPRDVVSVPTDCNAQKVRVCRYTVIDEVQGEFAGALYEDDWADDGEEAAPFLGDGVVAEWEVESRSNPGTFYTLTEYEDGFVYCECPSFRFRSSCKHGGAE